MHFLFLLPGLLGHQISPLLLVSPPSGEDVTTLVTCHLSSPSSPSLHSQMSLICLIFSLLLLMKQLYILLIYLLTSLFEYKIHKFRDFCVFTAIFPTPAACRHIVHIKHQDRYLLSARMNVKHARKINILMSIIFFMKQDQQVSTNGISVSHFP